MNGRMTRVFLVVCVLVLGGVAVARAELGWTFSLHQELVSQQGIAGIDVALEDLDGDGDVDAYIANDLWQPDRVWINQGSPTWLFVEGQGLGESNSRAVALGDLDGDGDLDAFVVHYNQSNRVYFNNGDGTFTASVQEFSAYPSQDVALGYLNDDEYLDAFIANDWPSPDIVLLNTGDGTFGDPWQWLGNGPSRAVALDDLDGDGDLDAFVATNGEANQVWLMNEFGLFEDGGQYTTANLSRFDVALASLNPDVDDFLDAVVVHNGVNEIWLGLGNGLFLDTPLTFGDEQATGVAVGDLDGDGDMDVVVSDDTSQANKVWLNDGSGGLSDTDGVTVGSAASKALALGTLDATVSLDVFVANYDQPSEVWIKASPTSVGLRQTEITAGPAWWVPVLGVLLLLTLFVWRRQHNHQ
ncbi:MAG: FG-GAP-like repeat-containing protein [Anaerolineae bacterium]|nr:FG-GAP-like repeat-containing protein [Anaerolineae bacterium]